MLRHMPEAAPHERDETRETRQQLQRLLDSAYDVRGHRTAGRILDDPAPEVSVEGVSLSASRRAFLKPASGCTCPVKSGPTPLTRMHGWIGIRTASSLAAAARRPGNRRVQTGYGKEALRFSEKYKKRRRDPSIKCKIVKSRKTVWKRKTRQHL